MICIYTEYNSESIFVKGLLSKRHCAEDLGLPLVEEDKLLKALKEWDVQFTYDYRNDYCKDYRKNNDNYALDMLSLFFCCHINDYYCTVCDGVRIINIYKCSTREEMREAMKSLFNNGLSGIKQ